MPQYKDTENKTLTLGTESISILLLKFSVPAIVAMVAASLYNIIDSIFIGRMVSSDALSGLAITFPLMNLTSAFGTLFGVGAASLMSIKLGKKDYLSANYILGNLVILNSFTGISITILASIFLKPILIFFGASHVTMPYAFDYMQVILWGNVITHLFFGLNGIIRTLGHPKFAMVATLMTVLINIILAPLFISVFKMGVKGAALATICAQFVIFFWQVHILSDKKQFVYWQRGVFKLRFDLIGLITSIGLSPFLINAASCVIVILINHQLLKHGGDNAVGAYGIVNRLSMLFVMIIFGINQGMQPIVGYNYGAKQYDRVRNAFYKAVLFATITMCVGFVVIQLFPRTVASIFTTDKEQLDFAVPGLRWVFAMYPLVGFQVVSSSFFQSIGKANKAIILSVSRQVILLMPFLLIFPNIWRITGVWFGISLSDALAVILSSFLIFNEMKKLKKQKF